MLSYCSFVERSRNLEGKDIRSSEHRTSDQNRNGPMHVTVQLLPYSYCNGTGLSYFLDCVNSKVCNVDQNITANYYRHRNWGPFGGLQRSTFRPIFASLLQVLRLFDFTAPRSTHTQRSTLHLLLALRLRAPIQLSNRPSSKIFNSAPRST